MRRGYMENITKEKDNPTQEKDKQAQTTVPSNSKLRFFGFGGKIGQVAEIISAIAKNHPDATVEFFPKLIEEELMLRNLTYHKSIKRSDDGELISASYSLLNVGTTPNTEAKKENKSELVQT
jgi:hypothetical protein